MHIRLVGCVWMVMVLGAYAIRETGAARREKRGWWENIGHKVQNQAHKWGMWEATCPQFADLPCPVGAQIAEKCDQPYATKLMYWNYNDFGNCFVSEYRRAAAKQPACAKEFDFYAYAPYWYYPNPRHWETRKFYRDQKWDLARKECAQGTQTAEGEQQQPGNKQAKGQLPKPPMGMINPGGSRP